MKGRNIIAMQHSLLPNYCHSMEMKCTILGNSYWYGKDGLGILYIIAQQLKQKQGLSNSARDFFKTVSVKPIIMNSEQKAERISFALSKQIFLLKIGDYWTNLFGQVETRVALKLLMLYSRFKTMSHFDALLKICIRNRITLSKRSLKICVGITILTVLLLLFFWNKARDHQREKLISHSKALWCISFSFFFKRLNKSKHRKPNAKYIRIS